MNMLRGLSDNIRVDPDKCIFCGKCAEVCILDNIRLQLAPCRQACPIHTNCQGYVQLIARGKFDQALEVVREGLPFPGIIGRICHHPCEDACNRRQVDDQPVAIRALKRFLDDHEEELNLDLTISSPKLERVAIIGAGPAGMMAAWELRRQGYGVEIYEATSKPGGMLSWGIPEFRLPGDVVEREFGYLLKMGVELHLNTRIGKGLSFQDLYDQFDAIFVAIGAPDSARLDMAGETAKGVYHGLDFLYLARENREALEVGRNVVVIGGGNTAIDAAQTALRLGAESVRVVCLEARHEMPAFTWEIEDALAEGVELVCSRGPDRFIVEDNRLQAVELKTCTRVFDETGVFNPSFEANNRCTFETDTMIIAIGQKTTPDFLNGSGIELVNGRIEVDPITYQTNLNKVFAGGDVTTGPKSVIEAMAAGKAAAESIRRLLQGEDLAFGRDYLGPYVMDFEVDTSMAAPQRRVTLPRANGAESKRFIELELTMTESQAIEEARRCLNCGLPQGFYRNCWFCLPCEVECPEDALWVEIPYLMR
jgi:NADPH-dependent glutamate synthase beta subunit-like oxidoreductase